MKEKSVNHSMTDSKDMYMLSGVCSFK